MKKLIALLITGAGLSLAQSGPSPLDNVPPPLAGALMDLYSNYQQNRPQLPLTEHELVSRGERLRSRNTKIASGAAIGAAIGALVAPNDRGKASAIGAVAGAVAAWIVDHEQAKRAEKAAEQNAPVPVDQGGE